MTEGTIYGLRLSRDIPHAEAEKLFEVMEALNRDELRLAMAYMCGLRAGRAESEQGEAANGTQTEAQSAAN